MSRSFRAVAVALGLTTIWTAWLIEPLVEGDHNAVLHWSGSASLLFGPVLVDVAIVWTVFTALLLSAQAGGRWRIAVWAGVWASLPWIVLRNLRLGWPNLAPEWFHLPRVYVWVLLWLLLVLLWRPAVAKRYETVIDSSAAILMFVAISGVFFLTQLGWFFWQARSLNDPPPLHRVVTMAAAQAPRPRIIWIVLDELSYQQVYGHRYPGLQLPAFDELAGQAAVFTHVVPAGDRTDKVLPSLLTGIPIDKIRSSADGRLSIHNSLKDKWQRFDEHNTVFQDALTNGYETRVEGWYNPYCRILPAVLDHCYWTNNGILEDGMTSDGTVASNLWSTVYRLMESSGTVLHLLDRWPSFAGRSDPIVRGQVEDYENLLAATNKALLDRSSSFTLLHIPVPHPPGIYNRETGQLGPEASTYIDNLALADKYLAHVRSLLEQTGQWDSSTVIVMGDHGWRTTLIWEHTPYWRPEEERASLGGKFDPRPGYIVKLAGQKTGTKIDLPFHAVETRALLDALMAGRIRTAGDLEAWVQHSVQGRNP